MSSQTWDYKCWFSFNIFHNTSASSHWYMYAFMWNTFPFIGEYVRITFYFRNFIFQKKCEQYWPKTINKAILIDNFRLTMTAEICHTVYVYRLIILHNKTVTLIHSFMFTSKYRSSQCHRIYMYLSIQHNNNISFIVC